MPWDDNDVEPQPGAMPTPLTLNALPLFPLGTVLFPGGELPLRIFEVRYLDMITRCHRNGAPFGVVALSQGQEVRRPGAVAEAFHPVGTLATIESLDAPQPGLLHVVCRGGQRFRIEQAEQLRHGLWTANVSCLADDLPVPIPEDLKPTAEALRSVLQSLRERHGADAPAGLPSPEACQDDCGGVAHRWCELLPLPLELKARLLALDNPLMRLELVGDLLDRTGIGS